MSTSFFKNPMSFLQIACFDQQKVQTKSQKMRIYNNIKQRKATKPDI